MSNKYPPAKDCPTIWFARLERAREAHDRAAEQQAQAELKRLGVRVAFDRKAVTR